jgi:hypothetical protein
MYKLRHLYCSVPIGAYNKDATIKVAQFVHQLV